MKKTDLIKQLKLLHQIDPSDRVMGEIGKKIELKIKDVRLEIPKKENNMPETLINSLKTNKSWVFVLAFTVIIIIFAGSGPFSDLSKSIVLSTRIAIAPNQYEKTRIAIEYVKKQQYDSSQIEKFSNTLAMADTQLSQLKLMGEKGKYTTKQCKTEYLEFYNYLENTKKYISTVTVEKEDEKAVTQLKSQMNQYQNRADSKLKLY